MQESFFSIFFPYGLIDFLGAGFLQSESPAGKFSAIFAAGITLNVCFFILRSIGSLNEERIITLSNQEVRAIQVSLAETEKHDRINFLSLLIERRLLKIFHLLRWITKLFVVLCFLSLVCCLYWLVYVSFHQGEMHTNQEWVMFIVFAATPLPIYILINYMIGWVAYLWVRLSVREVANVQREMEREVQESVSRMKGAIRMDQGMGEEQHRARFFRKSSD